MADELNKCDWAELLTVIKLLYNLNYVFKNLPDVGTQICTNLDL